MNPDYPTIALDPIPGYPGYLVCRLGVVFHLNSRSLKLRGTPVPLRQYIHRNKYLCVSVRVNGKRASYCVHRLILETYVGPRPQGMECLHGPGGKHDNRLSNIRWGTHAENGRDMAKSGVMKGEKNKNSRLTERDVRVIRQMSPREAARKFRIKESYAKDIQNKKFWSEVN
jgi:hypothetical protein